MPAIPKAPPTAIIPTKAEGTNHMARPPRLAARSPTATIARIWSRPLNGWPNPSAPIRLCHPHPCAQEPSVILRRELWTPIRISSYTSPCAAPLLLLHASIALSGGVSVPVHHRSCHAANVRPGRRGPGGSGVARPTPASPPFWPKPGSCQALGVRPRPLSDILPDNIRRLGASVWSTSGEDQEPPRSRHPSRAQHQGEPPRQGDNAVDGETILSVLGHRRIWRDGSFWSDALGHSSFAIGQPSVC